MNLPSVCPILYDINQLWYGVWAKYVENEKAIKAKCFLPGVSFKILYYIFMVICISINAFFQTKFIHNPYNLLFNLTSPYAQMDGLYKLVVKLKAFNYLQVQRPTSICYEIKVQLNRQ